MTDPCEAAGGPQPAANPANTPAPAPTPLSSWRGGKPSLSGVLRLWWMLTWRSFIAGMVLTPGPLLTPILTFFGPLILYPLVASVAVLALRTTLPQQPLLGLFEGRRLPVSLTDQAYGHRPKWGEKTGKPATPIASSPFEARIARARDRGQAAPPSRPNTGAPSKPTIDKPTTRGTITGYEPAALKDMPVPTDPFMHGVPGLGLSSSGFGSKAIELGQAGETNFAKALAKNGYTDKFATFWSVHLPDEIGNIDSKYHNVDIDCVILSSNKVWLVDLKNYRQGDVTYHSYGDRLYVEDNTTGSWVGKPYKMSRNMQNAELRFAKMLQNRNVRVEAVVVFMPTPMGVGKVAPQTRWPDTVRPYMLPDFLDRLAYTQPYDDTRQEARVTGQYIKKLVKR